jgi:hypothetical protein
MGGFSLITLAALIVVGGMVVRLNRTGPDRVTAAALATGLATGLASRSESTQGDAMLTDPAAGLSYALLGTPWHDGCPRTLSTALSKAEFRWTSGEAALAGRIGRVGDRTDWYANACSGPLPRRYRGENRAQAAWAVADTIEPVYYGALRHSVTVTHSTAVRVGGRPGWLAEFLVHYSGPPHLAWSSELAAVVVTGNAVFYVSVPDNLGTGTVAALLGSLKLSSGFSADRYVAAAAVEGD